MPLYEYGCLECGVQFEKLVRTTQLDPIFCPKCESTQVERLLSLFATSQGAPDSSASGNGETASPTDGAMMHKPHCGYDWM